MIYRFIIKLPKICNNLQKTEIQKTKQSKTEKNKQNKTKTKQILKLIEESIRLRHIRHEGQLQICTNLIYFIKKKLKQNLETVTCVCLNLNYETSFLYYQI